MGNQSLHQAVAVLTGAANAHSSPLKVRPLARLEMLSVSSPVGPHIQAHQPSPSIRQGAPLACLEMVPATSVSLTSRRANPFVSPA